MTKIYINLICILSNLQMNAVLSNLCQNDNNFTMIKDTIVILKICCLIHKHDIMTLPFTDAAF